MSRRPYSYTVLRYVHDIVTGEFVNVGIVLTAPAHDAQPPVVMYDFSDRITRLRSMFPDVNRAAFVDAMQAMRRNANAVARQVRPDFMYSNGDALSIAMRMLPRDGSSLQWSDIGTGIARDIEKEFQRISARMLHGYQKRTETKRSDDEVWRPVRQALHDRNIQIDLEPRVIDGDVDSVEFQHAWKNGKIHAYEPLSFDLADASNIRDKARRWRGNLDAATAGAHQQFKAYFIAGRPSDPGLIGAYESALEILRHASGNPEVYEESQIDELVSQIERDVLRHQGGQAAH